MPSHFREESTFVVGKRSHNALFLKGMFKKISLLARKFLKRGDWSEFGALLGKDQARQTKFRLLEKTTQALCAYAHDARKTQHQRGSIIHSVNSAALPEPFNNSRRCL